MFSSQLEKNKKVNADALAAALWDAIEENSVKSRAAAIKLIKSGANPNYIKQIVNEGFIYDSVTKIPLLHKAWQKDNFIALELLLKYGANPDAKYEFKTEDDDPDESSGLVHWAAAQGDSFTFKLLLDHGADPNNKNIYNQTALVIASSRCRWEFLNNYGDYVLSNKQNIDKNTQLLINFKKIYKALRDGQSGLLKSNFLEGKEHLPVDELLVKIKGNHDDNRLAKAWELTQKYQENCSVNNTELFSEIYKWSFENSGLFKKSHVLGLTLFTTSALSTEMTRSNGLSRDQIKQGCDKANSRTANIYRALR